MKRAVLGLILFGIAFGYVEASVVVYLRAFYDPLRAQVYPGSPPGELFPMLRLEHLHSSGSVYMMLLAVELGREAATLIMLAAAALAFSKSAEQWLAAFSIAFGVWDISFYLFLKALIGWPASLLTWDILFLLPLPWAAPVLAPVLVSITLISCGLIYLLRPARARPLHWMGVSAGGLIVILSFMLDCQNLLFGGMPAPYPWWLFALGEAIGIGVFAHAALS